MTASGCFSPNLFVSLSGIKYTEWPDAANMEAVSSSFLKIPSPFPCNASSFRLLETNTPRSCFHVSFGNLSFAKSEESLRFNASICLFCFSTTAFNFIDFTSLRSASALQASSLAFFSASAAFSRSACSLVLSFRLPRVPAPPFLPSRLPCAPPEGRSPSLRSRRLSPGPT